MQVAAPEDFRTLCAEVAARTNDVLRMWLESRLAEIMGTANAGPEVNGAVESMRALALRGGKRFRAALIAASYVGLGGKELRAIEHAFISIELLQTYLLIHDDWMDNDDRRRGGPSVHCELRTLLNSTATGDAAAILVGDLASSLSQEALLGCGVSERCLVAALRAFADLQSSVVMGQLMDVCATAKTLADVEKVYARKTGSYTVSGPLKVGAALAGADPQVLARIERLSLPIGVAFQLRDDVLGTFGKEGSTGKSSSSDIRQKKKTALIVGLEATPARALVEKVFSLPSPTEADAELIRAALRQEGVLAQIEARIATLRNEAMGLSDTFEVPFRSLIRGAISMMVDRDS